MRAREELFKQAGKLAEDTRVQLRRISQTSIKKGGYEKNSVEIEEVRCDSYRFKILIDFYMH